MTATNLHTISISTEMLKTGDRATFEQLYDKYSGALFNIILRIIPTHEIAEDVLQDSFVKIWKNIHTYDSSKGALFTWMLNICRNTAVDATRKAKTRPSIQTDTDNVYISNLNSVQINTNTIGLKNSLKHLTPDQILVIDAIYFNGMTHDEASKVLQIPLGTVKSRVRNALLTLKTIFCK